MTKEEKLAHLKAACEPGPCSDDDRCKHLAAALSDGKKKMAAFPNLGSLLQLLMQLWAIIGPLFPTTPAVNVPDA